SLDANRVEIRMNSENVRSRNVAERLGFVYEGTLRNAVTNADGAPRDGCVYSLIPEDFAALGWR
ncbi:MAG: GNAT family protein, partial [Chloroflexia bacterium]